MSTKLNHRSRSGQITIFLFLLTLFCCFDFVSANEGDSGKFLPRGFSEKTFQDEDGEHRYLIFVPLDYDEKKKWPIVMFLHGAGQKGTDGIRPAIAGLGTALAANPKQKFIAIFPQCENLTGRHLTCWLAGTKDSDRALNILKRVEEEYSIDTSKRTLCGWSMGGYGAWSLAAAEPDFWAGVLSISGGETEREVPVENLAKSDTVVWAVHGKEDTLIPFSQEKQLIEKLIDSGGTGVYTLEEGVGHSVWRYLFNDPKAMEWLANPSKELAASITNLSDIEPLPQMSQFYIEHYTHLANLPKMLALRMGNDALQVISQGIPEVIPPTALSGKFDDIERSMTSGGETVLVKLSDIDFDCQIANVTLKAISGGRFRARFEMNPLRLSIGSASLKSDSTDAKTGQFEILMGHREPVTLELEIQPSARNSRFELIPLKRKFTIPESNWHINPPEEIEVNNSKYSEANIVTGIVGGLYLQKEEIEETVLGVVPSFLKVVEAELQSREAPKLARLLWPLPALIPDIVISPSQVRTDPDGISMVFDLLIRTTHPEVATQLVKQTLNSSESFEVTHIPSTKDLNFDISLGAVDGMGRLVIQEGFAYINVQDLQNEKFATFATTEVLQKLFPTAIQDTNSDSHEVGMRLVQPFQIQSAKRTSSQNQIVIELFVPDIAFEVREPGSPTQAVLHFSLRQNIQIETIEKDGLPSSLKVTWLPDPKIQVSEKSTNTAVNKDEFQNLFSEAWSDLSETLSGKKRPVPRVNFGNSALGLKSFTVEDGVISLNFTAVRIDDE